MAVEANLRMSFHDMDLADAEPGTDTGIYEERPKDNLSESDILQQFLELWHEKGDLLIYKAFVTRFPDCAPWYDQITGSIPSETEIQIVTSELLDSCIDSSDNELVCYSADDQEHLYSNANNEEHVHVGNDNHEHLHQSDNEDIPCRGLQMETPHHEQCEGELGTHIHSDVHVNVCEVTSVDKQFCGDACASKEEVCCKPSNIVQSQLDQNDSSLRTELPTAGEITRKHTISDADVPVSDSFTEAAGFPCQAGNCSDPNILSDEVVSSVSSASSVANSVNQSAVAEDNISARLPDPGSQSAVAEDNISARLSDPGSESAVAEDNISARLPDPGSQSAVSDNEHGYSSRTFVDHSYTNRADLPYSIGQCQDGGDGQDASEEFGPGELMAWLQEAHEDLRHQVFLYVRDIFSQWVRENPGEEFDVSSLDQYLLAVATPVMEVEFVYEQ